MDIVRRERPDYLLRDLYVLDLHERVGQDVVWAEELGEEGTRFSLTSPLGDGGNASTPDVAQELIDIGRLERNGVVGKAQALPPA